jgi:uncharacterized membrane protein
VILASLYTWLLFVHVLAAAIWVGGAFLLAVLVIGVIRACDPDEVARFGVALRRVGPVLLAPATVATIGVGVWLVLESAAWDFGQFWIQLALGLFAAAFLVGAVHQRPHRDRSGTRSDRRTRR